MRDQTHGVGALVMVLPLTMEDPLASSVIERLVRT
jgi:hypothetical protein